MLSTVSSCMTEGKFSGARTKTSAFSMQNLNIRSRYFNVFFLTENTHTHTHARTHARTHTWLDISFHSFAYNLEREENPVKEIPIKYPKWESNLGALEDFKASLQPLGLKVYANTRL